MKTKRNYQEKTGVRTSFVLKYDKAPMLDEVVATRQKEFERYNKAAALNDAVAFYHAHIVKK